MDLFEALQTYHSIKGTHKRRYRESTDNPINVTIQLGNQSKVDGEYYNIFVQQSHPYSDRIKERLFDSDGSPTMFYSKADAKEYIMDLCKEFGIGCNITYKDCVQYSNRFSTIKENSEDDLETAEQEISSAKTSINSNKLPAIFNLVQFKADTINLDYGGGKFDNATQFLQTKDVTNLIYDPYNRSSQHNNDVLSAIRKNGGADTATCSNVLNVIKEENARLVVIKNIYKLLKSGGTAYFTVYEGNGSGEGKVTSAGYQLNKKTLEYIEEIQQVFSNVSRKGKVIIAKK